MADVTHTAPIMAKADKRFCEIFFENRPDNSNMRPKYATDFGSAVC